MKDIQIKAVILGAGNAGKYLYDQIEKAGNIDIVGFIDNYLEGEYKGIMIYRPSEFFALNNSGGEINTAFIAVGAQKTLKSMIDICCIYHIEHVYMMHDIAGKCRLPVFNEHGVDKTRIRKLKFSDLKPSLAYFEVPITDSCNLNCKGCLFASNLTRGSQMQHVDIDQLESDARRMSELFYDVPWIRILGGEPLMHPELCRILKYYRKCFPSSEIDLCTNGLLIPAMPKVFWDTIKEARISIHISGYKPVYTMLNQIDCVMKEHNVPYAILKREEFSKYYTEEPIHDMQINYESCGACSCYEVYRGKLAGCSAVIAFDRFNKIFGTKYKVTENEDWFDINTPDFDAWKVKKKLESPSYICRYCNIPKQEKFEWGYSATVPNLQEFLL